MTYKEKLLDPRWQKIRLLVFQRDKFTCVSCGSTEETLHVHHEYYVGGREPWEYPLSAFKTMCWECHENASSESTQWWESAKTDIESSDNFEQWADAFKVAQSTLNLPLGEVVELALFLLLSADHETVARWKSETMEMKEGK